MTNNNSNKGCIDPAIIAAVIGVIGTLIVTLITLYLNRPAPQPPPTPFPSLTLPATATITDTPVPTDTVPVGESTSTPAPDTPIPEPTLTIAAPAIGSDWANGCISVLWKPYPSTIQTTERNGCLVEPVNYFFVTDGRLTFALSGEFGGNEVYGLFAPLPANGTASVQTFLKTIQKGEIWMGVFAEPTIESQGIVMVIPEGDVTRRQVIQKTMPGQNEVKRTEQFSQSPPVYEILFEISNGTVKTTVLRDTVFDALPVGAGQQWLFVGYQIREGKNRIDAEFLNLVVQGQ